MSRFFPLLLTAIVVTVLVGAGCAQEDAAVINTFVEKPWKPPGIQNLTEEDNQLVIDTFLTPAVKIIPGDVSCPDAKPYDREVYLGATVHVWKLKDGKCYPSMQFSHLSSPDKCKERHYHMDLMAIGGQIRSDSQPCGAAVESDVVEMGLVWVSPSQYKEISERVAKWRKK